MKATPFITVDDEGTFVVAAEGAALLEGLERKVGASPPPAAAHARTTGLPRIPSPALRVTSPSLPRTASPPPPPGAQP